MSALVTAYGGTKQDLARVVQITPSRLSHLLKSSAAPSVSAEVCLRLASATGYNPSVILRAAGKHELAALLESLYGAPADRLPAFQNAARLTPAEQADVATWRKLPEKERRALRLIVASITDPQ